MSANFELGRTKYGQVRYFFGDDKRGHLFSKWGMNPKAWTKARAADDKDLKQLTNVGDYDPSTRDQADDSKAHVEVGDLVALAGQFHRSIDEPLSEADGKVARKLRQATSANVADAKNIRAAAQGGAQTDLTGFNPDGTVNGNGGTNKYDFGTIAIVGGAAAAARNFMISDGAGGAVAVLPGAGNRIVSVVDLLRIAHYVNGANPGQFVAADADSVASFLYQQLRGLVPAGDAALTRANVVGAAGGLGAAVLALVNGPPANITAGKIRELVLEAVGKARWNQATKLNVAAAKDFVENVLQKWNDLSDYARGFYEAFMDIRCKDNTYGGNKDPSDGSYVVPTNKYSSITNLAICRMNMKKAAAGDKKVLFMVALPDIESNVNLVGGMQVAKLRAIYKAAYNNDDVGAAPLDVLVNPQPSADPSGYFSLNLDELIRKRLFKLSQLSSKDLFDVAPTGDMMDVYGNIWSRDSDGTLFTHDKDGNVVRYGMEDEASKRKLKSGMKCYSTASGFKGGECRGYVLECLLSNNTNNLQACLQYLEQADKFKVAQEEIKEMHPIIAYYTLRRFGFKVVNKMDDTAGQHLDKVQSAKEWSNEVLSSKLNNAADVKKVTDNENLMKYLEHVVDYVNCNPAILNKEFAGQSAEAAGDVAAPEVAKELNLEQRMDPNPEQEGAYGIAMAASYINNNLLVSGSGFGHTGGLLAGSLVAPQAGGGAAGEKMRDADKVCGADLLRDIVSDAVAALKDTGKSLAPSDKANLDKLIKNIESNEEKIKRTIKYMDEFADLSKALGDQTSKVVTEANMRSLLNKNKQYISRNARDQLKLLSILAALRNMVGASGIQLPSALAAAGSGASRPMPAI